MSKNGSESMKKSIIVSLILNALSVILLAAANKIDGFAQWYSINIYPFLVRIIGSIWGEVSFSVVEILLYITVLLLVLSGLQTMRKKMQIQNLLSGLLVFASVLFFLYVTNCGINYYRDSFAECVGLEVEEYSVEELEDVCVMLTEQVNQLSAQVKRGSNGLMLLGEEAQTEAVNAMQALSGKYVELKGYYPKPKRLLFPWILAVQQLSGIYSPFTIEANYNSGMVDYNIPFTMCHELSHLRGFMQEEEANFIAYLACMESDSKEFQYSGSMLGWIYCTNVLYKVDYEGWKEIRVLLEESANTDLKVNSAYWDQYDGEIAEIADKVNDTYLKVNGQEDGVQSYNRMVDLMVNYYRKGK